MTLTLAPSGPPPAPPADLTQWVYPAVRHAADRVTAVLEDHASQPVWRCRHDDHRTAADGRACAERERTRRYADAAGRAGHAADSQVIGWTISRAGSKRRLAGPADLAALLDEAKVALREHAARHILASAGIWPVTHGTGPDGVLVTVDLPGGQVGTPETSILLFTEGLPAGTFPVWPDRQCIPIALTRLIRITRTLQDAAPTAGNPGRSTEILTSAPVLRQIQVPWPRLMLAWQAASASRLAGLPWPLTAELARLVTGFRAGGVQAGLRAAAAARPSPAG